MVDLPELDFEELDPLWDPHPFDPDPQSGHPETRTPDELNEIRGELQKSHCVRKTGKAQNGNFRICC